MNHGHPSLVVPVAVVRDISGRMAGAGMAVKSHLCVICIITMIMAHAGKLQLSSCIITSITTSEAVWYAAYCYLHT